jgi:hypothetical protein
MAALEISAPPAGLDAFSTVSDPVVLTAQSDEGRKIGRVAAQAQAHRLMRGRAVLPLSEELTGTAVARRILGDALERYHRPDGYEGHLVDAAWEIEHIGREAWPVLRELVLAGARESEYFLGAVARLDGIAPQQRSTALLAAARSPDANVRSRLLELLEEMPAELRGELLRELTPTGAPTTA